MRKAVLALSAIALLTVGCKKEKDVTVDFNSQDSKFSYAVGYDFGKNMKPAKAMFDKKVFLKGVEDAFAEQKSILTQEEAQQVMQAVSTTIRDNMAKESASKDKAFFEENGKKPGVITTPSGLQYQVVKEGNGPKPTKEQTVTVHYTGTLLDGTEFDSSVKRGEPATFPVGGVIPGWVEGLQLMTVGSKYKFFIPSSLGYGERGAGGQIPPFATLIFDVELLNIQ
jgi:FKBP-type peptidyl-prolyl cis-trans isomerase